MRELDFHGLRDDAGAAARQPDFDSVRGRAERLRRLRGAMVVGSAVAVAVLLGATGLAVAQSEPTGFIPGRLSENPDEPGTPYLRWAGAGDADHLYAVVGDCASCPTRLLASTDGGDSWHERPVLDHGGIQLELVGTIEVLSPSVLVGQASPIDGDEIPSPGVASSPAAPGDSQGITSAVRGATRVLISADGGTSWQDLDPVADPVPAVPPGGGVLLDCELGQLLGSGCTFVAVDPANAELAPLANQPRLAHPKLVLAPAAAGLWASGVDASTGHPAVAVSRDRGATWDFSALPDPDAVPGGRSTDPASSLPTVATTDGETLYATVGSRLGSSADPTTPAVDPTSPAVDPTSPTGPGPDERPLRVYRSGDGGQTWQLVDGEVAYQGFFWSPDAFVTSAGAHVLLAADDDDHRTWLVSANGDSYQPHQFPGLPEADRVPRVIDRTTYLYQGDDRIYLSGDGSGWHEVPVP